MIGDVAISAKTFNPSFDAESLTASVNGATDVQVSVAPAKGGPAVRIYRLDPSSQQVQVKWDGQTDDGAKAPVGDYRFELRALNGPSSSSGASDTVSLTNKRIIVSLDQQELFAYEGSKLMVDSLVTTGGPELPTPTGTFHILDKTSPMVAYSPWPKGSPYWFPDVTYNYAIEFFESPQYGLYIHDASWRHEFGPGSNTVAGTPGTDTTGTHGCINVPLSEQTELFKWAPVGTPVIVQR